MRGFALALAFSSLALSAACAPSSRNDDEGADAGSVDASSSCTAGGQRCWGGGYQTCVNGAWVTQDTCTGTEVCTTQLGCTACDPAMATTCVGTEVHSCASNGTIGGVVKDCSPNTCASGQCTTSQTCTAGDFIYLVDDANKFIKFDPHDGVFSFSVIGNMSCPAGPPWDGLGAATPFSMSIDRSAKAWVLYSSGEIFHVNTTNAACTASTWAKGKDSWQLFGMGFVTDTAGGSTEKLYIAGGPANVQVVGKLGAIDPSSLQVTTAGNLPTAEYSPELTGTGNAELYAYFPGLTNSFVARLDKSTAAIQQQWPLPALDGSPSGWAFAHWGGRFYIFISTVDPFLGTPKSAKVLRLDPTNGQVTTVVGNMPYKIVGAGVSTCAPVVID